MIERIRNEPVLLTTLVGALLTVAIQFGIPISDTQANALNVLVVAGLAVFARSKVTPTSAEE